MADQSNRGGAKQGNQHPAHSDQAKGNATHGAGERQDADKRKDQMSNPDDAIRKPTD